MEYYIVKQLITFHFYKLYIFLYTLILNFALYVLNIMNVIFVVYPNKREVSIAKNELFFKF